MATIGCSTYVSGGVLKKMDSSAPRPANKVLPMRRVFRGLVF
jgi:hypothetical protein